MKRERKRKREKEKKRRERKRMTSSWRPRDNWRESRGRLKSEERWT
jgi:hypothetical protein